jgi:hypothetical protein
MSDVHYVGDGCRGGHRHDGDPRNADELDAAERETTRQDGPEVKAARIPINACEEMGRHYCPNCGRMFPIATPPESTRDDPPEEFVRACVEILDCGGEFPSDTLHAWHGAYGDLWRKARAK